MISKSILFSLLISLGMKPAIALTTQERLAQINSRFIALTGYPNVEQLESHLGAFFPYAQKLALTIPEITRGLEVGDVAKTDRAFKRIFEGELAYAEKSNSYSAEYLFGLYQFASLVNRTDPDFKMKHSAFRNRVFDLFLFDRAHLGVSGKQFRAQLDWDYLAQRIHALSFFKRARLVTLELGKRAGSVVTFSRPQMLDLISTLANDPLALDPVHGFASVFDRYFPVYDPIDWSQSLFGVYQNELLPLFAPDTYAGSKLRLIWKVKSALKGVRIHDFMLIDQRLHDFLKTSENQLDLARYLLAATAARKSLENEFDDFEFTELLGRVDLNVLFKGEMATTRRISTQLMLAMTVKAFPFRDHVQSISTLFLWENVISNYLTAHPDRSIPDPEFEQRLRDYSAFQKQFKEMIKQVGPLPDQRALTQRHELFLQNLELSLPEWESKVNWRSISDLESLDAVQAFRATRFTNIPMENACDLIFSNSN